MTVWSRPIRAQWPIVAGANFTLEAASSSAASDREIQSEGAFDIGQSGSFEELVDFSDDLSELPELREEPPLADVSEPPPEPPAGLPEFDDLSPEAVEESPEACDELPDGTLESSRDSELEPRGDELADRFEDRSLRAQPVPL